MNIQIPSPIRVIKLISFSISFVLTALIIYKIITFFLRVETKIGVIYSFDLNIVTILSYLFGYLISMFLPIVLLCSLNEYEQALAQNQLFRIKKVYIPGLLITIMIFLTYLFALTFCFGEWCGLGAIILLLIILIVGTVITYSIGKYFSGLVKKEIQK